MKVEIRATLSVVTAAVMLLGCASRAAHDETSGEYRRLSENASQRLVCKRQAVLGTRVDSVVCVTEAEMKAQREHADDVMRDIQAHAPTNGPMNGQGPPNPPPPPSSPPPRQ